MAASRIPLHRSFGLWVAMLLASLTMAQVDELADLTLVGNRTGVVALTEPELRALFRGERSLWPSGEPVVIVLPGSRVEWGDGFASAVLGMSRLAMQRYWLSLVFQGRASAPVFEASSAEMLEYVLKTPGAVAMVPSSTQRIPQELVIPIRRK